MRWRLVVPLVMAVALGVEALLGAYALAAVPAWTTYRHDAARSGIDPDSASPVTPSQAWQTPALDGQVYGQPLVYGSYLYVGTENESVYKIDAATGAVVWSEHLATPEPSSMAPCGDISPSIGVTSTPIVDPATDRMYLVGAVLASGAVQHELFAVDLGSGRLVAGFPMMVDPLYRRAGVAANQLQRAGLALDGGRILIGYGGNAPATAAPTGAGSCRFRSTARAGSAISRSMPATPKARSGPRATLQPSTPPAMCSSPPGTATATRPPTLSTATRWCG